MCLALGLNRKHDVSRISQVEFAHRSKLFWTAYVLDRKLSSLIGVPPRLHDEDIGLVKPSLATATNVSEIIMAFHIDLSSQLGDILQGLYSGSWELAGVDICTSDLRPRTCPPVRIEIRSRHSIGIETTSRRLQNSAGEAQAELFNFCKPRDQSRSLITCTTQSGRFSKILPDLGVMTDE